MSFGLNFEDEGANKDDYSLKIFSLFSNDQFNSILIKYEQYWEEYEAWWKKGRNLAQTEFSDVLWKTPNDRFN